jgi:hypothetical protein
MPGARHSSVGRILGAGLARRLADVPTEKRLRVVLRTAGKGLLIFGILTLFVLLKLFGAVLLASL